MFLHVHWRDCVHKHSFNRPHDFIVDLPSNLNLETDGWEVALISYKVKTSTKDPLFLLSDICQDNHVRGALLPVLGRLDTKIGMSSCPQFIKVSKQNIQSIRI